VNTISLHPAVVATILAVRRLGYAHALAAAGTASATLGGMALAVVGLVITLLVLIARAARSLMVLASEFLRVVAEMTSAFLIMVIVVVVAVLLLVRH
jgi:hypothetical protein